MCLGNTYKNSGLHSGNTSKKIAIPHSRVNKNYRGTDFKESEGETDELIDATGIVESGLMTQEDWEYCEKTALQLFGVRAVALETMLRQHRPDFFLKEFQVRRRKFRGQRRHGTEQESY